MGYRSAGTVEFIVDVDSGDYYFMASDLICPQFSGLPCSWLSACRRLLFAVGLWTPILHGVDTGDTICCFVVFFSIVG